MTRLWLAVALCVVIFLVLADDADAWMRRRSCTQKSGIRLRFKGRIKSNHHKGRLHLDLSVGHKRVGKCRRGPLHHIGDSLIKGIKGISRLWGHNGKQKTKTHGSFWNIHGRHGGHSHGDKLSHGKRHNLKVRNKKSKCNKRKKSHHGHHSHGDRPSHGNHHGHGSSPCGSNPCLNHGHCIPQGRKSYRCRCGRGFRGTNCETPIRSTGPCDSNPCFKDGTCNVDGNNYWCSCTGDYEGLRCEIDRVRVGPCDSNPCRNYAQCVPSPSSRTSYSCSCVPGYTGIHCETAPPKDPCSAEPCKHDGSCILRGDGLFSCQCTEKYDGALCENGKNKVGTCPVVLVERGPGGLCNEDCDSDSNCVGDEKCCSNGCGHSCKTPCGPMCRMWCLNGFVYKDGCATCKCKALKVPIEEVITRPVVKIVDAINKNILAFTDSFDFKKATKIRLSIIWDENLRITFKDAGTSEVIYIIEIGRSTAYLKKCEDCNPVKDASTKRLLKKSSVESTEFYIRFAPDGMFEVGLESPDIVLMTYYNNDEPPQGQVKMYISAGGSFTLDWEVKPLVFEDSTMVTKSTTGDDSILDLILKPINLRLTSKLKFSVIGGHNLRIGLKSVETLLTYYVVHIGDETSSIELCDDDNNCETKATEDTPDILSRKHFVDFYITFGGSGSIQVGREGEDAFMIYDNDSPKDGFFNVFISSSGPSVTSWKVHEAVNIIEDIITWRTHNVLQNSNTWTYTTEPLQDYEKGLQVGVAADNEASIGLMASKTDTHNAYDIVFRAEDNTKILIKKGGRVVKSAAYVLESSRDDDYSNFWINWDNDELCIGSIVGQDNNEALLCWSDLSTLDFRYVGFKGDDYLAYYTFEYQTSYGIFTTYDSKLAYPLRFKRARMVSNKLEFGIMTDNDAHVSVSNCQGTDTPTSKMYELVLGTSYGSGCFFRRCKGCKRVAQGECPDLLDETEHREYTFEFGGGRLRLYRGRGDRKSAEPLLSWDDPEPLQHLGYMATATGFHSRGVSSWIIYQSQ